MSCYKEYNTINGQEKYDQVNQEDFKVDLKNFIDRKSNKIKFKLSAVMKLLPYNGFYPQQRTAQIAGIFNKVYLDSTGLCTDEHRSTPCYSSSEGLSPGSQGLFNTLAITQPFFSPGILFNTIKSGIAVDWPTKRVDANSCSLNSVYYADTDCYYGTNYFVKDIDYRFPFESLLDPHVHLKDKSIAYLNPSHITFAQYYYSNNYFDKLPYIDFSNNLYKSEIDKGPIHIYKSAINNFLYETANFFLKGKGLSWFRTKEYGKDESLPIDNTKLYTMDIVIRKHPNFSMFNTVGYSGSNQYIPIESLFGPPVKTGNDSFYGDKECYLPYAPPYFRDSNESRIRLKFFVDSSTKNLSLDSIRNVSYALGTDNYPDETIPEETNIANNNKMNLASCLNLYLTEEKDDKVRWYIQTKFETPLINFSKCSKAELERYDEQVKEYEFECSS